MGIVPCDKDINRKRSFAPTPMGRHWFRGTDSGYRGVYPRSARAMVGGANPLTEKTYEIYSNTRNRLRFRWVSCRVMKILIGRGRSHQPPWVGTGSEALTQATGVHVHPKTGCKALNTAIYWMAGGVMSVESNPPTPSWYPIPCLPRGARIQRLSFVWWR